MGFELSRVDWRVGVGAPFPSAGGRFFFRRTPSTSQLEGI